MIEALAVDAHRRGDYDASDRLLDQRLEQDSRAEIVGRDVALDRVHTLANADFRGEMDDRVHARQRTAHGARITHIAAFKRDVRIKADRPRRVCR